MIKNSSISKLAAVTDIIEVARKYCPDLKRSGNVYKCLSPFQSEKTPSCFFHIEKNFYKDFSSGNGGDAIDFIMKIEKVSYIEALEILAEIFSVPLEREDEFSEKGPQLKIGVLQSQFIKNLVADKNAYEIAVKRFGKEATEAFGIGLYLKGEMIDQKGAAGLLGKNNREFMDYRMTFPLRTRAGITVGFSARTLKDEKPKYINSRNSDHFVKSELLYGLRECAKFITREDYGYLVEGQTDVIAMYNKGLGAVSTWGTSLSSKQAAQMLRLTKNWTIIFDEGEAGEAGTANAVKEFLKHGIEPSVIRIEGDPEEYLRDHDTIPDNHVQGLDILREYDSPEGFIDALDLYLLSLKSQTETGAYIKLNDLVKRFNLNRNTFDLTWKKPSPRKEFQMESACRKYERLKAKWATISSSLQY